MLILILVASFGWADLALQEERSDLEKNSLGEDIEWGIEVKLLEITLDS